MTTGAPVRISEPWTDGDRVAADVDGETVWFESPDDALQPLAEVWASAFLVAAAALGRPLVVDGPVGRRWAAGAPQVLALTRAWWGWDAGPPVLGGGTRRRRWRRPRAVGLCFSGGADSFHSLLRPDPPTDLLVSTLGYDVLLDDPERCASMEADVRATALAVDRPVVVVRTNLQAHPLHRGTDWGLTHGGAMAALGHLLGHRLGTLCISASHPRVLPRPWGSRWDLDPLWSSDVTVRHVGAELWRDEKIVAIADTPAVQRHLRVCWEHRSDDPNCGRCEKCVRTAVALLVAGRLDRFPAFPQADVLAERLHDLDDPGQAGTSLGYLLQRGLPDGFPTDVRAAVETLVARAPALPRLVP